MLALSLGPELALREVDPPHRPPGFALVRVLLAGICNTDLEIVKGYMGFAGILGHEFVGEVVAADDPRWLGKRVNAEINLACGRCDTCARGLTRHCPERSVLGILGKDGCFAEWVSVPEANLVEVPAQVSDEAAVFTEPLAAAYEILEQVALAPEQRVLVLGDGKLGLLCSLLLVQRVRELHLLGKHPDKLAIAQQAGVITHCLPERPQGAFDVVVEATGSPEGLKAALAATRPRGTLVLKSTFHGATAFETAPIVIHELTVVGSRCGPFPPALAALAGRKVDPSPLICARYALADALTAFDVAAKRGALKVLLDPRLS